LIASIRDPSCWLIGHSIEIASPTERGWLPPAIGFRRIGSLITESKYGHSSINVTIILHPLLREKAGIASSSRKYEGDVEYLLYKVLAVVSDPAKMIEMSCKQLTNV
jgi:hypothetical protein